jgi:tRNA(Ile)-lysidine synthase
MRLINEFVQNESAKYQRDCIVFEDGEWKLLEEPFSNVPAALKANIIRQLLFDITGKRKDIEAVHLKIVEELLGKQVGRKCELPYGVKAIRSYQGIDFRNSENREENTEVEMSMRVFEKMPDMTTFPGNPYTKWFDYDIIKNTVVMSARKKP